MQGAEPRAGTRPGRWRGQAWVRALLLTCPFLARSPGDTEPPDPSELLSARPSKTWCCRREKYGADLGSQGLQLQDTAGFTPRLGLGGDGNSQNWGGKSKPPVNCRYTCSSAAVLLVGFLLVQSLTPMVSS